MNTQKLTIISVLKSIISSAQIRSTFLVWVMVAGVCAVLANVIAKAFVEGV